MTALVDSTFDDRTLLQIAVGEPDLDRARQAWAALASRCGGPVGFLDQVLDDPARRLLPLLGARADQLDLGPAIREQCRLETDIAWGLNVRIFETIRPVLERCHADGIRPAAFKGLALYGDVHPEHRLRACGDVDLLIRRDDLRPVLAVLTRLGWRVPHWAEPRSRFGAVAVTVCHPSGVCADLHFRPSRNLPYRKPADTYPTEPVPANHPLADTGLVRLHPLHQLFVLCLHCARPENRRIAHLLVDLHRAALTFAGGPGAVGAGRAGPGDAGAAGDRPTATELVELARRSHVEHRVTDVLTRLSTVFDPAPFGELGGVTAASVPGRAERRAIAAERRRADAMEAGAARQPGLRGIAHRIRDTVAVAGVGQGPARHVELTAGYMWQKALLVAEARRRTP